MPTYEYQCSKGHEFEEFQSITAEPVAQCPRCGREARRLISGGAGLIFKGSGFYITDYKKNGSGSGGDAGTQADDKKAESSSKPETSETASGSGDSKPATAKASAAGS